MAESNTRTVAAARNPVWGDASHTMINLEVNFIEVPEEFVPFTAGLHDSSPHGRSLFAQAASGFFGEISPYVPPVSPPLASVVLAGNTYAVGVGVISRISAPMSLAVVMEDSTFPVLLPDGTAVYGVTIAEGKEAIRALRNL